MSKRPERVLTFTSEADQGAEPEVLAAHQRLDPDGIHTFVFGDIEEEDEREEEQELEELTDSDPFGVVLSHARSHILRDEASGGLRAREVDPLSVVHLDVFNVATMPEKLMQAIERVETEQDPSFFNVTPILSRTGKTVALVGIDRNAPYDFIVELMGDDPDDDPEIFVYGTDSVDIPDDNGYRMMLGFETDYEPVYKDDGSETYGLHVFNRSSMLNDVNTRELPFLCVSFGLKAYTSWAAEL